MPPPHTNLTSGIRGFICKSCRVKLQIPQQAPWHLRHFTAQTTPLRSKDREGTGRGPSLSSNTETQQFKQTEEPFYKYFDETPDGVRTETQDDPEEEELLAGLREAVRELEDDIGDVSAEELEEVDEDERPSLHMEEWEDAMDAKIERLQGEVTKLESITNKPGPISEEDRQDIRNYFLKSIEEDESDTANELPLPPTSSATERFLNPPPEQKSISKPYPKQSSVSKPQPPPDSITIPPARYPHSTRSHIVLLNNVLRRIHWELGRTNPRMSEKLMLEIWRYYTLCRTTLLSDPEGVSPTCWKLLWAYVSLEDPTNLDRMAHVKRLGLDMQNAGIHLGGSTLLLYIEAVFMEGDPAAAIRLWQSSEQGFSQDATLLNQYLELGTRMFAECGEIDAARKAASTIIQSSSDPTSARILIHVIQGCLASTIEDPAPKAWDIYLEFRKSMGSRMEMRDYDDITGLFLKAGHQEAALAVFKDMMLTSDPAALQYDSLITKDSVQFPSRFNNKFFFGKWLKKLIGSGDLEEARRVLDLMRDIGICPDAKFTNGLIGAWLRSGTLNNRQLAEDMAWSMIARRLEFVKARQQRVKSLLAPLRVAMGTNQPAGSYKTATLNLTPRATMETFSILVAHYVKGQKSEQLMDLYSTLAKAKIPPDTYFLNTVLSAEPKMSLDTKGIYYRLIRDGVEPGMETFLHLWHNLRQRRMQRHIRQTFFNTRELFAEMMSWAHKKPEIFQDGLPEDIYNLVISCFGLEDDQAGTAVALRAMQRYFKAYPTDNTARHILLQITSVGVFTSARRRRLNLNSGSKERLLQVTQVLQQLRSHRIEALAQLGIVYEELQEQAKAEEALALLTDFLRIIEQKRLGSDGRQDNLVALSREAANQMGVPDCVPWLVYNDVEE